MKWGDFSIDFKTSDEVEQAYCEGFNEGYKNALRGDERVAKIADHYGFTSQADMLSEESAEFMVELNKLRRGKAEAYEDIKVEVEDVLVFAKQLRYLFGADYID